MAVGLTLTWGVMDIINFAHGEFLMIGMYTAFWMYTLFALDPLVALPICIAVLFILGILTYTGIISRVINAPGLTALLATFGLSMFLKNLASSCGPPITATSTNPWYPERHSKSAAWSSACLRSWRLSAALFLPSSL